MHFINASILVTSSFSALEVVVPNYAVFTVLNVEPLWCIMIFPKALISLSSKIGQHILES